MKYYKLFVLLTFFVGGCKKENTQIIPTTHEMRFSGYQTDAYVYVMVNGKQSRVGESIGTSYFLKVTDTVSVIYLKDNIKLLNGLNILIDNKTVRQFNCICDSKFDTIIH
jgi:hypothetical protein